MKVLHVGETVKGGIIGLLNDLIPLQTEEFGEGNVLVLMPESQADQASIPAAQIRSFARGGRDLRSLGRLAGAIVAHVRRERPQILHLHSFFAGLVGRLLRPLLGDVKIVYCPHAWAFQRVTSRLSGTVASWTERGLAPLADRVICVSEQEKVAAMRHGVPVRNVTVVRNGLGDPAPRPAATWRDDRLKALFIGRFDRQKGIDLLLDAARTLADEVAVTAIGDAVVSSTPVVFPDDVRVFGWMKPADVQDHIGSADVVVMPSRWEGLPLVALEAARAGKPVVGSRVGGIPEVVLDGETGVLFEPDSAEALVAALRAAGRADLGLMGRKARDRFSAEFTIAATHRATTRLYREVLGGRAEGAPPA